MSNNNNNNNTSKPSSSPPVGAPTAPRAMRERNARRAAYPPLTVRRIAPSPGLFQPPTGNPYNARSDANASRRISSDGSMYSQPSGDPRLSARPPILPGRPTRSELSMEQVIASREPTARKIEQRRAEQAALEAQQRQAAAAQQAAAQQAPTVQQQSRGAQQPTANPQQQYQAPVRPHQAAAARAQQAPAPAPKPETKEEKEEREKKERIEAARKRFEEGRGFDDDDEFCPGHRRSAGSI
ncbi:uncharacterized protein PG986_011603 [Apiospora aurea]|uniref:Uncharacterized protein n=1 Tax=Apiospora aurea TaxID=335848 RepID=A0ABR1PXM0_9PEZI